MEEKSVMSKLKKVSSKRQMQNIVNLAPINVDKDSSYSQNIFDAIPIGVISVDLLGKIQYMNRAARLLLGEPDQTLVLAQWPQKFGLYLRDDSVLYPEDKLPLARALDGETVEAEGMILRKGGDQRGIWISMSSKPISNEQGIIDGALACIQDISHRKQTELSREKQVQRIEALYNFLYTIAEAGNDLNKIMNLAVEFTAEVFGGLSTIALLNVEGDKLKVGAFHDTTRAAQAFLRKLLDPNFEYEHSQTLAGSVIQSGESLLLPSITAEQLQAVTLPVFEEFVREFGIQSVLIVPLMGKTGVVGTINLSRHPGDKPFNVEDQSFVTDIAYHVARAIEKYRLFESLLTEVTERQSAKQALARSEERFHSIFESVTVGVKVLEVNGDILQTNSAFQEMIGYTEAELVGRKFYDFLYLEDIGQAIKLFQDVKRKGTSHFRFEHRAIHKDHSILWVKTIFTVIQHGTGDRAPVFIVGIVENITEQKRLEAEMAELNSRLQSSVELERLRVAQELHDGPMQSLHSAIYRVEELRSKADPQFGDDLKDVKDTIQSVLQDLRATAKELRPPTIFNFGLENAIRSHANDIIEKHSQFNIHLSLAHDRQILPEKVRLALFRIFQQSMANVIRHSEATDIRVRFSFDAEEAHLEVSDNGKGFEVPPNWMEFVRHGHYGLAGAAERATALGGVLNVESKSGKSTTVRVTIPWMEMETNE
jgi:PAS domain S-box-containing protein